MSDLAIDCRGLSKRYQLGQHLSLQHTLAAILPGRKAEKGDFEALHDVSFQVPAGSFFGIVGTNGSGKSTLTQCISGITVPNAGECEVWGRILPLLEVGAGMHGELSGRENVTLLGSILGIPYDDIADAMPRIVEFAGIEQHFDTPLKRYSTGMRARLSFATAVCFPSEIYVFDEVLAVVDDDFRNQCVAAMRRLHAEGRTILFMSHDLDLVMDVCDRGMWLEKGRVQLVGDMTEVGAAYARVHQHDETVGAAG